MKWPILASWPGLSLNVMQFIKIWNSFYIFSILHFPSFLPSRCHALPTIENCAVAEYSRFKIYINAFCAVFGSSRFDMYYTLCSNFMLDWGRWIYKRVESVPHQVLTSAGATVRHYAVIYGMFKISKYWNGGWGKNKPKHPCVDAKIFIWIASGDRTENAVLWNLYMKNALHSTALVYSNI